MITAKEEFVGCEKYVRAYEIGGADAIMMWWALKCYAAKHPGNAGFVPDETIDRLIGAPRKPRKALDALVRCGRLLPAGTRGAGLVELTVGGWQLHDYLDHANAPEDDELRREKQRAKKQQQREEKRLELAVLKGKTLDTAPGLSPGPAGTEGDMSRGHEGTCPGDRGGHVPGTEGDMSRGPSPGQLSRARARPRVYARARTRVGARVPQPNPTQPSLSLPEEREIDSNESRPDPELVPAPARPPATPESVPPPAPPAPAQRCEAPEPKPELMPSSAAARVPPQRSEQRWRSYPKGWRAWSLETTKEAVAQGLTTADLAGHVDYWTTRAFPGGAVDDLDFELYRSIPGIAERKRKAAAAAAGNARAAPEAPNPHGWAPTAEHRAIASRHALRLRDAMAAYRASGIPDRLGTVRANEDFSARLRWWAEHGGDFPLGKPRRRVEALPEARKAVGA